MTEFLLLLTLATLPAEDTLPTYLQAALSSEARSAEDKARDAHRKPGEVLQFFGIKPGMQVAELMAGAGWYAEIMARAVGPKGKVYAHNSPFVLKRFAEKRISKRMARIQLDNLIRINRELDDPGLPKNLDAVVIMLFYHDAYWQGVDRAAMNKAVFDALRPGGVYGVVDHHAEAGSGDRDVRTIHRVEREMVVKEILAAGFELAKESDLLRHPEDDRKTNVFSDEIRGKTDRFVIAFRKPK